ncbi:MAG: hypothetical protein KatS3mg081_0328 [Gemmatimonadales bacterium]|nr:MAG: hypothetical protein KatS3mg081_0328 [Gemmatimonadales bacterium]
MSLHKCPWVRSLAPQVRLRSVGAFAAMMTVTATLAIAITRMSTQWDDQEGHPIYLEEMGSVAVPDSFPVTGMAISRTGEVFLYSAAQPYVLHYDRGRLHNVGQGVLRRPVGIAAETGAGAFAVLDAGLRSVLLFKEGRVVARQALRVENHLQIEDATRLREFWFVLARDRSDNYIILKLLAGGGWQRMDGAARVLSRLTGLSRARLIATEGGVILMHRDPVLGTVVLSPTTGEQVVQFALANVGSASELGGSGGRWVSLWTVELGRYYLQTLADLRSDRRALVLFEPDGRVVRERVVDIPMGIGASASGLRLLAAVRRAGTQELVIYRWNSPAQLERSERR